MHQHQESSPAHSRITSKPLASSTVVTADIDRRPSSQRQRHMIGQINQAVAQSPLATLQRKRAARPYVPADNKPTLAPKSSAPVQRMQIAEFTQVLKTEGINPGQFMAWFEKEFTIWQNIGAFDSTLLGYNKYGQKVYKEMYATAKHYIEDEAFTYTDQASGYDQQGRSHVLNFHIQDFKAKEGHVDNDDYLQYLYLDKKVVDEAKEDEQAADVKGADHSAAENVNVPELFADRATYKQAAYGKRREHIVLNGMLDLGLPAGAVAELGGNAGKNNLGIFRAKSGRAPVIIKVLRAKAVSQFRELIKKQGSFPTKQDDPDMPAFANLIHFGTYQGLALGIFEAATGDTLGNLHDQWSQGKLSPAAIEAYYGSVGKGLGAFNFKGVKPFTKHTAKQVNKAMIKTEAPVHNDANPYNIFVDSKQEVTLIDNDDVNPQGQLISFSRDMGYALANIDTTSFEKSGREYLQAASPQLKTAALERPKQLTAMLHAFGKAYLAKSPGKSVTDAVKAELRKKVGVLLTAFCKGSGLKPGVAIGLIAGLDPDTYAAGESKTDP